MLDYIRNLRSRGVLGLNERNVDYIQHFNPRRLYPLVDDKLQTKRLALEAGIAVPELYGVIENQHDVRRFGELARGHRDFVVKPAHGSGGEGILVIAGYSARRRGVYRLLEGDFIGDADIAHHVSNILSGQYSLGGHRDCAMLEYRVRPDPIFEAVAYRGVPDVRVIVCLGYPVMAMVRLPTRRSHGKANLHQGAVGAGIDLTTGRTLAGVLGNESVDEHPDTGEPVSGIAIPRWDYLLSLAGRCYELTGLGYLGVDIVLDSKRGPLILELNARPGLNIQIANQAGLKLRLARVTAETSARGVAEKVAFSRTAFAG